MADMQMKNFFDFIFCCCLFSAGAAELSEFKSLWTETDNNKRRIIQDAVQKIIDRTSKAEFDKFDTNPNAGTSNSALKFYDAAFDRLHLTADALHAPSASSFSVIDPEAGEAMKGEIECARMVADSVGGSVECAVIGLPVGLGNHPFDGMEGRISAILFSIPAVKAVAFGDGFDFVTGYGSTHNDAYRMDGGEIVTKSNHCGGIVGGMSTGMPVIFSCGFKPTPSIAKKQQTVSLKTGENAEIEIHGRHDPCILPRAVPVVEAMAALVLAEWHDFCKQQ